MYSQALETFIVCAESRSFSEAAEKLYVSAPAVIRQIKLFEKRLGLQLFERTPQGISLTPKGEIVYRGAKDIVRIADGTLREARNLGRKTILRIGIYARLPKVFQEDYWPRIRRNCHDMRLELVEYPGTQQGIMRIQNDLGGKLDIALGLYDPAHVKEYCCVALEMLEVPSYCLVSPVHRLAEVRSIRIGDLEGCEVWIPNPHIYQFWHPFGEELRHSHPSIRVQYYDVLDRSDFVLGENENRILIKTGSEDPSSLSVAVELEDGFVQPFGFWYRRDAPQQVKDFIARAEEVLSTYA